MLFPPLRSGGLPDGGCRGHRRPQTRHGVWMSQGPSGLSGGRFNGMDRSRAELGTNMGHHSGSSPGKRVEEGHSRAGL